MGAFHAQACVTPDPDVTLRLFGQPTTAYEFSTTGLSGLTAYSPTPDVENANTTIPGAYFVQDNASGTAICGRFATPPSPPYTGITKIIDANVDNTGFHAYMLNLGEASPGLFDALAVDQTSRTLRVDRYTSPTVFSTNVFTGLATLDSPMYLAIRVNSSTDVDYLYSLNGYIWREAVNARNPSITIGSLGIAMKSEGTGGFAVAFEYLRIYNSALTMPGA